MIYSFNYKRGTQVFDNVKSLADAINFELPRNWDCSGEMNRKADEINAFIQKKVCRAPTLAWWASSIRIRRT